jgi:hypothetical protein
MNSAEEEGDESMTSSPRRSSSNEDNLAVGTSSAMATMYRKTQASPDQHRIVELESENSRLQKLVAELLLKNQQLRKPE